MNRIHLAFALAVALLIPALLPPAAFADHPPRNKGQDPYAVIDAVNALRASQGLPPYTVSSTLMGVAQAQAEYMASTGNITHTGPDGSRPYQRGLAAGYPLAGQIPPGFFSENIMGAPGLTPQDVVQNWTGDAPHMNTMNSAMLQEIGAGVAVSGGTVYYVIDCARPTTSGLPQAYTPGAAESSFSSSNELIMPVTKSTPNPQGEIIHEVQAGQSLWQIAIEYGVKIDQIRSLNQLSVDYLINPGDTLLIMTVGSPTPAPATLTPEPSATLASPPSATPEPTASPSLTPTPTPAGLAVFGGSAAGGAVAAIVIAALASAALVAWAGRARPV
jgi:LysM repeat protein